ncbi:MAG: ABC transporter permease, partial [Gemmatimonadetes bacterium]|nr:ABC transporter permease [Gemmatimonadota bacterium]
MIVDTWRDLRYAARSFARRPLFTGVLVVTLALGIGSTVAIFSVAQAVLFNPMPYDQPEALALIWTRLPQTNVDRSLVSGPDFQDYQDQTTLFDGMAGAMALEGSLTGDGPAEQITTGYSTWQFFDVLGVTAMVGRTFQEDDAFTVDPSQFGSPNVDLPPGKVVLTHGLWQRRFGSDPSVIGRTIQMDGFGSEVVGVLPPDFRIYLPADVAMPTDIDAWGVMPSNVGDFARDVPWMTVVARMRDGVSVEQAQAEMDAIASNLRAIHPFHANQDMQISVAGMHRDVVAHARPALLSLLGAVAFVLLIACANVANLLIVRASERGREIAVRSAMGSGRGRIVRQMLTESFVLAAFGAVVGVLLAWYGVRIITSLSPGNLPRLDTVGIDLTVLAFTAGITAVAALVFGLMPALRAVAGNLATSLKDRGSAGGGLRGNKLRTGLAVTEVALSLVLLIGAGLMLRSLAEIQRVEPGFDPENVVTFSVPLGFVDYFMPASRATFVNQLARNIEGIPGVESVGGVAPLPLAGGDLYSVASYGRIGVSEEQYQAQKADYKSVLPGFFASMDIELVSGRFFVPSDNEPDQLPVAIIDEKLAERAFGTEDPIGKELMTDYFSEETFELERRTMQVVGVVANVRATSLAEDGREALYVPYIHNSWLTLTFTVRTRTDPARLLAAIRTEVTTMDPAVPVSDVAPLSTYVDNAMSRTRFLLALIGVFAGLALVLASLGLYGVISYGARQRTREIGVRMAFGATDGDVLTLVLRQGMAMATAGVLVGLLTAAVLTRVMESLLVGVSATD